MDKTITISDSTFLIILISLVVFTSCNPTERVHSNEKTVRGNEQIDIHLPAMYTGILPCASCPGTNYRLIIEDNKYIEIRQYQDRSTESFKETGFWEIKDDTLTLTQPEDENFHKIFLIKEKTLTLLDSENQQITGDLAHMYILERTGDQPSIREHHQKLARQGFKFFAGGNEPFWAVKINSVNSVIYETPEITNQFGKADSSIKEGHVLLSAQTDSTKITIQAEDTYCQDSMSGYLFPREVKIILQTMNTDTLSGCGLFLNG